MRSKSASRKSSSAAGASIIEPTETTEKYGGHGERSSGPFLLAHSQEAGERQEDDADDGRDGPHHGKRHLDDRCDEPAHRAVGAVEQRDPDDHQDADELEVR